MQNTEYTQDIQGFSLDEFLRGLNPDQYFGVTDTQGPCLIIAGAGSGKTRVLTGRIANLLRQGADPKRIMALTFTKKAAGEMKSRIKKMAGPQAAALEMGTFHSVFSKQLRIYGDRIGIPSNYTIWDSEDSASCLKSCIETVILQGKEYSPEERKKMLSSYPTKIIQSRISILKNNRVDLRGYTGSPELQNEDAAMGRPKLGEIFSLYTTRCRTAGALDFDDILLETDRLLCTQPDVLQYLSEKYQYILVDEYQDTNTVQYSIIRNLSTVWRNLCVVGDDSQSIYAFRGARIQNILNFRNDFPDAKYYKLTTNYRSTSSIVNAANRLISRNNSRIEKTCLSSREEGIPVLCSQMNDERHEANYIAAYINREKEKGAAWSDFAILYRTNAQSMVLENTLRNKRIPYVIFSGLSFYERTEVKDTIAYLKLAVNPNDDEAFKRICNKPSRGISDKTLATMVDISTQYGIPLFELAKDPGIMAGDLKGKAISYLKEFSELLQKNIKDALECDALEAAEKIIERSGILEYYKQEDGKKNETRTSNIKEVLSSVGIFRDSRIREWDEMPEPKAARPEISLSDYLEDVALMSNADTEDDGQRVKLMTIHASKGLEFPTVFVTGLEKEIFPGNYESPFELEEERRLFYVAMTRAQNRLIITHCDTRMRFGRKQWMHPSVFLKEIGQ